jgi:glycosyltransferase involved in cell wall biosynthesis
MSKENMNSSPPPGAFTTGITGRSLSIVVPAFNEGELVTQTADEIEKAVGDLVDRFEIVLVNDCSTDNTGAVIDRLARERPHIVAVHNPTNLGLGGAYKAGLAKAHLDNVMLVPGDNAASAEDLRRIIGEIGKADIVVPYVVNPAVRTPFRVFLSSSFTNLVNVMFGLKVPYYNGLVIHRREVVSSITIKTNSFAYQAETLVRLLRKGHSFVPVSIHIRERQDGETKAFRLRNMIQIGQILLQLFWETRILGR